eukprot:TRINITY_DN19415_c0_g1::TRINITY_DN19415_c0_g1_i1::g.7853::m.7853 TRINITY_DN19415_c0_g1::TRINITY_DN19415_c0_g1_i1::g.7853  ORF type:complete len:489 (-),score=119.19,sp/Q69SA9/PDI54_ORYSJ/40.12/2e-119,COPIIcoated_ERV/PF07970.7/6.1e-30,ERGIC_N/PF13850.1/3.4e-29,Thioredoxin/PF00085.15/1.5e-13,Thioredoxin_2/PF13098.1/0.031,Carn_acyltransf/PF00755.15/0.15,Carn_acyltransf/PF00755.15/8.5e+02 TRINITY_DN19415_c0_g1_i1:803-2116(-)
MMVDQSAEELLQVNFNVSFPRLSCELVSVDVSDMLGEHQINITQNIRKWALDESGDRIGAPLSTLPQPKYAPEAKGGHQGHGANEDMSVTVNGAANLKSFGSKTQLFLVNYYAPWCPWSKRLHPEWEHAAGILREKYTEAEVRLGKVDCTVRANKPLCMEQHIQAFPSVRIYRHGEDTQKHEDHHHHESYLGDRTATAISDFVVKSLTEMKKNIDPLALPAPEEIERLDSQLGQPAKKRGQNQPVLSAGGYGCQMDGFVKVKKVPGNIHFSAHSLTQTIDASNMDMSHQIHHFSFGPILTDKEVSSLPQVVRDSIHRLDGRAYLSEKINTTHDHYLKVLLSTFVSSPGWGKESRLDTYEFTVNSHSFVDLDDMPQARFNYDLSPIQVIVKEEKQSFAHFLTSSCAIIGGVFTVAGIVDALVHQSYAFLKKLEMGKQH